MNILMERVNNQDKEIEALKSKNEEVESDFQKIGLQDFETRLVQVMNGLAKSKIMKLVPKHADIFSGNETYRFATVLNHPDPWIVSRNIKENIRKDSTCQSLIAILQSKNYRDLLKNRNETTHAPWLDLQTIRDFLNRLEQNNNRLKDEYLDNFKKGEQVFEEIKKLNELETLISDLNDYNFPQNQ